MEKIFDGACIFYLFEVVTDEVIVFVSKIKLNVALFFLSLIVHCLLTGGWVCADGEGGGK